MADTHSKWLLCSNEFCNKIIFVKSSLYIHFQQASLFCVLFPKTPPKLYHFTCKSSQGAQWLSGGVLDWRPRVRASPASLCCVFKREHLIGLHRFYIPSNLTSDLLIYRVKPVLSGLSKKKTKNWLSRMIIA